MNKKLLHDSILRLIHIKYSRSGGPGGQNVNKVNTKVFISCNIKLLKGLSDQEMTAIQLKLHNRFDSNDCLFLSADEERSQLQNRMLAIERLESLIIDAAQIRKKRIHIHPGKKARIQRLKQKKYRSLIKKGRSLRLDNE